MFKELQALCAIRILQDVFPIFLNDNKSEVDRSEALVDDSVGLSISLSSGKPRKLKSVDFSHDTHCQRARQMLKTAEMIPSPQSS